MNETVSPTEASSEMGPCDLWTGARGRNGYGRDRQAGRAAHVVAWLDQVGPIPPGFVLDHECHNLDPDCAGGSTCLHRACRSVDHLVLRSIGENARRGFRTRSVCGRGHPWTEANTYWRAEGRRMCRRCCRLRQATRKDREADYHAKARARMARLRASRQTSGEAA